MDGIEKIIIQTENSETIYQTEEAAYKTTKRQRKLFGLATKLFGISSIVSTVTLLLPYFAKPVKPVPADTTEGLIFVTALLYFTTAFSYLVYRDYKKKSYLLTQT